MALTLIADHVTAEQFFNISRAVLFKDKLSALYSFRPLPLIYSHVSSLSKVCFLFCSLLGKTDKYRYIIHCVADYMQC